MKRNINALLFLLLIASTVFGATGKKKKDKPFHFYVVSDVHEIKQKDDYTNLCLEENILPAMKNDSAGPGKFIIIPGDMDPFKQVRKSVENVMGKKFRFYPVIGNHDVGMTNNDFKKFPDANWGDAFEIVTYNKKHLKNISNWGPVYKSPALDNLVYKDSLTGKTYHSTYDKGKITGSKYTTYSFDEGNSHFVVLDIYSGLQKKGNEHDGRISNELFAWLEQDLNNTTKENIFVIGHQPVWETGGEKKHVLLNEAYKETFERRAREHGADSLQWFKNEYENKIKSRDDFWNLLKKHNVVAYFCGHTHHHSVKKFDGVWEINLEFGAWCIEGRTMYGEVFVDDKKVELIVKGFKEKTWTFETTDRIVLKE